MEWKDDSARMRQAIETAMQQVLADHMSADQPELRAMLGYHLGWEAGNSAGGKRIRPQLVLLAASSVGADWRTALPAAAAVELVHNFSLIHDDIQDQSPYRHGRPTVWVKWGVAQAINAGDVMFTLAHQAIYDLRKTVSVEVALQAAQLLDATCLRLTEGQYLDLSYESRAEITLADYWPMIHGKTAALLGCCTALGALVGGADAPAQGAYQRFGEALGLAFQVLDDGLGIWGDSALTGKSNESDLVSRKKTLPVLFGLAQGGDFAQRWREERPIQPDEVLRLSEWLKDDGALEFVLGEADRLTNDALVALAETGARGDALETLRAMAARLLERTY